MKSLLIIRHAKSSWDDLSQKDFDRPLNNRGKKDAPEMAKRICKEKGVKLDAIISSPANRAFTTAKFFAEEFDIKKKNIIKWPELYEASVDKFYKAVMALSDDCATAAVFSHNPGITAFANSLTNVHVDDMPTCAIYAVHIQTGSWKDFKTAKKEFWFFDYPKSVL
ncbi:MAG: histidine phosphatase family protein [Parafilimonas sp.]